MSVEETIIGKVIVLPIDDIFVGECLTSKGKSELCSLKQIIGDNKVFIECSTNRTLCYNATWELGISYAYKVAVYLIRCCGINPQKVTYIGYGNMFYYSDEPNRVQFTIYK